MQQSSDHWAAVRVALRHARLVIDRQLPLMAAEREAMDEATAFGDTIQSDRRRRAFADAHQPILAARETLERTLASALSSTVAKAPPPPPVKKPAVMYVDPKGRTSDIRVVPK